MGKFSCRTRIFHTQRSSAPCWIIWRGGDNLVVLPKTGTHFPCRAFKALAPARSGTSQLAESQGLCYGWLCWGKGATWQNTHLDSAEPFADDPSTWRKDKPCKAFLVLSHRTARNMSTQTELHFSVCRQLLSSPSGCIYQSWDKSMTTCTFARKMVEAGKDTTPWWGAAKVERNNTILCSGFC